MRRVPLVQGQRARQIDRDRRTLSCPAAPTPLGARPPARGPRISGLFTPTRRAATRRAQDSPRAGPRFTARRARSAHNDHAHQRAGQPTKREDPRTFGLGPRSKVFGPDLSIPNPETRQNKMQKGLLARKTRGRRAPNMMCATRLGEARLKRKIFSAPLIPTKKVRNQAARERQEHRRRGGFQSSSTMSWAGRSPLVSSKSSLRVRGSSGVMSFIGEASI